MKCYKLLLIMNFCVQNDVLYKHLIPESSLNSAFHRIVLEKNASFLSESNDKAVVCTSI